MKELTPEIDHCAYQLAIFFSRFSTKLTSYELGSPLTATLIADYLNQLENVQGWTIGEARVNETSLLHAFLLFAKYLRKFNIECIGTHSSIGIGTPSIGIVPRKNRVYHIILTVAMKPFLQNHATIMDCRDNILQVCKYQKSDFVRPRDIYNKCADLYLYGHDKYVYIERLPERRKKFFDMGKKQFQNFTNAAYLILVAFFAMFYMSVQEAYIVLAG
jgi:hypothetical protein